MPYKIDYFKEDIEDLFRNLENKDVKSYILLTYLFDKRGGELFLDLRKDKRFYLHGSDLEAAEITAKALSKNVVPKALFFEYGSGNCIKSKPFLKHLRDLTGFIALDIDGNVLEKAKTDIKNEFPNVDMHIVVDDFFTEDFNLPKRFDEHEMKIFYMSCNLINLFKREVLPIFFEHLSKLMKKGDLCIISIDTMNDIKRANELDGGIYCEKFAKNILHRLNNEFNGNFDEENFDYSCMVSKEVEYTYLNLISKKDHEVKINNKTYKVLEGKTFGTFTCKYNYDTVKGNGLKVGLKIFDSWIESEGLICNIGLEKDF